VQGTRSREMTGSLHVVGGVYRERCRLPIPTDETWGSGGRAAAVAAGLGLDVTLHTAVDRQTSGILASLAKTHHFDPVVVNVERALEFRYDHALSFPTIWPTDSPSERPCLEVDVESALVFGMLEATSEVRAARIVYDPQNPVSPEPFRTLAGSEPRVAYVLNSSEARKLSGTDDHMEAASRIAARFGAESVVIKRGPHGALVYEDGRHWDVPAYKTPSVWPVGSGDVFAAVFATRWACQGLPAVRAAADASKAAALYVNSRVLPIASEELEPAGGFPFPPLGLATEPLRSSEYHVYLAGPFFNIGQRWLIDESRMALRGMRLRVFSPLHDVGLGSGQDVAPKDIEGLEQSRAILALIDGLDAGTIFEIGYARSMGKPVIALAESTHEEPLKMVRGTGCEVVSDFVSALYRVAWAAQS
jgi:hypothetical protein